MRFCDLFAGFYNFLFPISDAQRIAKAQKEAKEFHQRKNNKNPQTNI